MTASHALPPAGTASINVQPETNAHSARKLREGRRIDRRSLGASRPVGEGRRAEEGQNARSQPHRQIKGRRHEFVLGVHPWWRLRLGRSAGRNSIAATGLHNKHFGGAIIQRFPSAGVDPDMQRPSAQECFNSRRAAFFLELVKQRWGKGHES